MTYLLLLVATVFADPNSTRFEATEFNGKNSTWIDFNLDAKQLKASGEEMDLTKIRQIRAVDESGKPRSAPQPTGDKPKPPTVWLETIDGSRIPGTQYSVTKGIAELGLANGDKLSLPTKMIRLVELIPPGAADGTWVADLKADLTADLIVVRKKESIDYVDGAAGDVTDETVNFSVDGDNVPVKRAKVAGIVYFHPPDNAEMPAPQCVYEDFDGWRVNAASVTRAEGQDLKIVTNFGGTISRPLEYLKLLDFSAGRMLYLGDLPMAANEWTPLVDFGKAATSLTKFYRPQVDRSLDGSPLQLAGNIYPKGLAIPSRTTVTYKITGKGKRFKALAGIDDSVREAGQVHLVISGDGKTLYDGQIVGRNPPVDLDLDVAGVKRLNILVDFGEGLDVGNYLDLCDARIVK